MWISKTVRRKDSILLKNNNLNEEAIMKPSPLPSVKTPLIITSSALSGDAPVTCEQTRFVRLYVTGR